MATSGVNSVGTQSSQNSTGTDAFKNLDLNQFIKLLVAELQNQDPMQPMSNSELIQQVSQIRNIESNDRLTTTLNSVALGQNLTNGGSLLQRTIQGLSDDGDQISGVVDRVTIEDGVAKLHIGNETVSLKNVAAILPQQGS